jgi:hypothetical protein
MLTLPELQHLFGRSLLADDDGALGMLEPEVVAGALTARDRLAVYRNNVVASLTEVLRETFPVVSRLVGEQFFGFAAREFIAIQPPLRPSLSEYGKAFPGFLGAFPACCELVYLTDTADLEWLLSAARYAADIAPVSAECLAAIAEDDAARLVFRFHPACGYLESQWPIDCIWRSNQEGGQDEFVDLDTGGARLEVSRSDDGVMFRTLDHAEFAFRKSLASGAPLGIALEHALGIRPDFPAPHALAAVFSAGLVVAVTTDKEHAP